MRKVTVRNGVVEPDLSGKEDCIIIPPPIVNTDVNLVQVSSLISQQIREVLMPISFPNINIQVGTSITFDTGTSTFILMEPGVYQVSFKVDVIKTELTTPDVGVLLVEDGNIANFSSYVRYTIGEIATISLTNTLFIQTNGITRLQLMTGAMFGSYSSCFMAVQKVG